MPLDSESQAVLQVLADRGVPPLDSLPPERARAVFNETFRTPDEDREAVDRVEDRLIPTPDGDVPIRLYAPASQRPLPALLHYHGGGWVIGDLETHDGFCRSLSRATGCAVVAVAYHTAPEHPFPAAAEDCFAALCWVAANASDLGFDGDRLGVIGDSAGGNLAAAVSLMARDRGGPALTLQVLTYPAVDASMSAPSVKENAEGYFLTESAMRYFWGHYLGDSGDPQHPYASPLAAEDHTGLPSAFVLITQYDPLRDEGEAYAQKLEEAGNYVELHRFDGTFHGFLLMGKVISAAGQALAAQAAFIRRHFGL